MFPDKVPGESAADGFPADSSHDLVSVLFPDSTVRRETHVEISVEEPDLLGAGWALNMVDFSEATLLARYRAQAKSHSFSLPAAMALQ